MLAAVSSIAVIDALAKYLAQTLHGVEVAWGYFVAMLLCVLILTAFRAQGIAHLLFSHRPTLQLARGLCLVMSLSCLFFSLRYLPLAEATTIGFTAPLFIVALSGPMLGEKVGLRRWAAVLTGLLGAIIVARPGTGVLHWAAFAALAGALFFAQFNIVTRMLGATDATTTTLLYSFGVGTVTLSLAMPLVWTTPRPIDVVMLAIAGVLGVFAHFAFVRALTLADASLLAPLNYTRLIWASVIGVMVFNNQPDRYTLIGGSITIASGLYVMWLGMRR